MCADASVGLGDSLYIITGPQHMQFIAKTHADASSHC